MEGFLALNFLQKIDNVNQSILRLPPYVPLSSIEHSQIQAEMADFVQLGCNENPRGPSDKVLSAMSEAHGQTSRYPDSDGIRLKTLLSERLNVGMNQITLGNGSSGVLDLISKVTLSPKSEAVVDEYCFPLYPMLIYTSHGTMITVPAHRWKINFSGLLNAINPNTRLIFVTNPGNPLGTWAEEDELVEFLDAVPRQVWVVLDEAYFEYIQQPKCSDGVNLLSKYSNLIVTRTFSKVYGLAALRIGYSVSSESMAEMLNRIRPPFNVSNVALTAAESALNDNTYVAETIELNELGRAFLQQEFSRLGISYLPSVGNFITIDCGRAVEPIDRTLADKGIFIRSLANYNLPNHLRVTIGLSDQNKKFISCLESAVKNS